MPTVPIIDLPQVNPTAEPQSRFDAPQQPEIAGKQMQQMGDAWLKAGVAARTIADRIQADKDDAATKEMDNKLSDQLRVILHSPEGGYLNRVGKSAVEGRDGITEAIRKARETVETSTDDPFQRAMFKSVADRRIQSALLQVDSHASHQTKVWHEGESIARMKSSAADAIANSAGWKTDGSLYASAKATALSEVDALADLRGYDSAQREQLKAETLAGIHTAVLSNMVSLGQAKTAREYLESAAPEIAKGAPDKLDNLRNLVKTAGVKEEAIGLSQSLKGGLQQQIKSLDGMVSKGSITPEVYDDARRRVEHNWQLRKTMENEGNKSAMGAFQDWILKNPGKSIQDAPTQLYTWAKGQGHLASLDAFAQREGRPAERQTELKTRGALLDMATNNPEAFITEFRDNGFLTRTDLGANGIREMQNIAADIMRNGGKYKQEFTPAVLQDGVPKSLLARDKKDEKDAFTAIMAEEQAKWIKSNPGKVPDAAAHASVIQAANKEWISIGKFYNSKEPAYKVRAGGDARAVPSDFYQGMKAAGAKDEEILAAWKLRQGNR